MAMRSGYFRESRPVSAPVPGPISTTLASGGAGTASTIFRAMFGSRRKFCPRRLIGRRGVDTGRDDNQEIWRTTVVARRRGRRFASARSLPTIPYVIFEDELTEVLEAGVVGATLIRLRQLPHEVLKVRVPR